MAWQWSTETREPLESDPFGPTISCCVVASRPLNVRSLKSALRQNVSFARRSDERTSRFGHGQKAIKRVATAAQRCTITRTWSIGPVLRKEFQSLPNAGHTAFVL
jgi:hypothetical protein